MRLLSLFLLFVLFGSGMAQAQQDLLLSQYMFNKLLINPAYAGTRDALSLTLSHRSQWVGIEGAPSTQAFSAHSPLPTGLGSVGLQVTNDLAGPVRNTAILGTYAYALPLGSSKLSMAIRGGANRYAVDWQDIHIKEEGDQLFSNTQNSSFLPTVDLGAYWYNDAAFVGATASNLIESKYNLNNIAQENPSRMFRHYMLTAGYAYKISDELVFKPSTLVRLVEGAPASIDLNASVLFQEQFWVGASYRYNNALSFIFEYVYDYRFRLGYSYDVTVGTQLGPQQSGSHEIFLGYDLDWKKSRLRSPRYF